MFSGVKVQGIGRTRFFGGLTRLAAGRHDILFGARLAGSLAAEPIGIPMLWIMTRRVVSASERRQRPATLD